MHPSSSSTSPPPCERLGLHRYGSAPGSFLSSVADSVVENAAFSPTATLLASTRSCFLHGDSGSSSRMLGDVGGVEIGLDTLSCGTLGGYSMADLATESGGGDAFRGGGRGSSSLFRHSSSPAGFFPGLLPERNGSGGGFSVTGAECMTDNKKLKSQLSFSSRQDSISHISGITMSNAGESSAIAQSSNEASGHAGSVMLSSHFQISSSEHPNSITFSETPGGHGRVKNGEFMDALRNIECQYGMPRAEIEMANVENLFQIQQDTIPCKIRAKRGCATHPRSIAERERRTRISDKLRKLQELVPNMDKQTSTADMLDLAVEYIKSLQSQLLMLNQEGSNCSCMAKHAIS